MTRFRTAFGFILALITVTEICPSLANDAVPVLLWGGSANSDLATSAVNPFLKTTREEFDSFLHKKVENSPPFILYVKDNLCVEDFMQHKQHLQKATSDVKLNYFPAVEKAVDAVENLPSYNQTYDDYVDSVSDGQLLIMSVTNLDIIPETYKTIKESSPNLVAMLTGRSCSYRRFERVKRDADSKNNSNAFIVTWGRVLLYASQPLKIVSEGNVTVLPLVATASEQGLGTSDSKLQLSLQFNGTGSSTVKYKLLLNFEVKTAGYYTLKTVNYELYKANKDKGDQNYTLTTDTSIVFPFNFSYHCTQNVTFKQNSTVLYLENMQVQIDPKVSNNTKEFYDAYDCVGFTTIPIWTGIFVTAILALIMIWALSMIIDIRTMDRFDDPKGKTITISSQE